MEWKCPECGTANNDLKKECSCGYAYYKILGVKPDATQEEVKQSYQYLQNVWQKDKLSRDAVLKGKALERLKKIDEAYRIFKQFVPDFSEPAKRTNLVKIVTITGIAFLIVIGLLVYLNISNKERVTEQAITSSKDESKNYPVVDNRNIPNKQQFEEPSQGKTVPLYETQPTVQFSKNMTSAEMENQAIELVKKSHAIDRFSDVETLMKKWTDEISSKFQIIGWNAKRMDDQTYLVSYTASDGLNTRGFYFDLDTNTGLVRHIADYPELQKKYGIQYNQ
jgi:hypothetical protein